MPADIEILQQEIEYAEKILLPPGKHFDDERKVFISNLDTIDLQAVPGSGKTTALMAKLLILENHLPFEDGSGILVISHTNAAVNEIKDKIGKHCPKLFRYPNFVGTIQRFVDRFLAIPFVQNVLDTRITWIDSEMYKDSLWKEFSKIYWNTEYDKPGTLFWGRLIEKAKGIAKQTGESEKDVCNELIKQEVQDLFLDYSDEKIKFFRDNSTLLADKSNGKYKGIREVIESVVDSGMISYEYAYKLAASYCEQYPQIIELIQKRFRYVFVDEMQDMDEDQYGLLEKIFYNEGNSNSVFQRIGDKNQAIYKGFGKVKDVWHDRDTVLPLNGSHRLSKSIAGVVNCFALERKEGFEITGLGESVIKPTLIIYDYDTIEEVIPQYAETIKNYQDSEQIPVEPNYPFKVVAWNTDWKKEEEKEDREKIRLVDYHSGFKKEKHKPKYDYPDILSYLKYFDKNKKTLESIRKNILNAFLKILRLEGVVNEKERPYTKRQMLIYLKDQSLSDYEVFKQKLFDWSFGIIQNKETQVLEEIRAFVPKLLSWFDKTVDKSQSFLIAEHDQLEEKEELEEIEKPHIIHHKGINIEVSTVHASKGQTHTATLYLETSYQGDYESKRLADRIKGKGFSENETRKYHQQSTVMSYVGLSRPTHLLCMAVHKDRFEEYLSDISQENWDIVDIT